MTNNTRNYQVGQFHQPDVTKEEHWSEIQTGNCNCYGHYKWQKLQLKTLFNDVYVPKKKLAKWERRCPLKTWGKFSFFSLNLKPTFAYTQVHKIHNSYEYLRRFIDSVRRNKLKIHVPLVRSSHLVLIIRVIVVAVDVDGVRSATTTTTAPLCCTMRLAGSIVPAVEDSDMEWTARDVRLGPLDGDIVISRCRRIVLA